MHTLLQINADANWGSAGTITEQITNIMIEKGWHTYVAYGREMNPSRAHVIRVGSKYDVYAHYAEHRFFDNEGLASRRATKSLVEEIERLQPDVVHLHNIHDHWLNFRILFEYLNQTDIKVVWTFHDFWPITGHCTHFVQADCSQFMIECVECPYTKGHFLPLMKRATRNFNLKKHLFTANHNLHIVSVSDWVGENVAKSFLQDKDLRVIHNGVDTEIFKPTDLEILPPSNYSNYLHSTEGKFVIMAVSSQWKSGSKGLDDYKAMAAMLKDDEVIVLVGVPEEISKDFPSNIIGIKRTSNQQELAALYTRADVVCSFSLAETFGLTIVEGYACGTSAVVYDNTAPPSLITPETGFVVPNGNYKHAYTAIQQIKINGKQHYSEACISLAREKYDKDKCFEKYVELYEELLKKQ